MPTCGMAVQAGLAAGVASDTTVPTLEGGIAIETSTATAGPSVSGPLAEKLDLVTDRLPAGDVPVDLHRIDDRRAAHSLGPIDGSR